MKTARKQRGRPRKKENSIQSQHFWRAGTLMCAYDEAREGSDKHSVAVGYAVKFIKQGHSEMPISETEVKRTLAAFRPRGSRKILRFKRSKLSEEDIKLYRLIREHMATLQGKKGLKLELPPNFDQAPSSTVLAFWFSERPNYPRHNRKNP